MQVKDRKCPVSYAQGTFGHHVHFLLQTKDLGRCAQSKPTDENIRDR